MIRRPARGATPRVQGMHVPALVMAFGLLFLALALAGCTAEQQPEPKTAIQPEPSILESLEQVHPDEPAEYTFNERFSLDNALTRVDQIREASTATGEAAMAMTNWTGAIEGTLMKQDYLAKKAEFELAKYQFRDGEITEAQYQEKESVFRKAEEDFKAFWEEFGISD
ncbi:MAG: hypothetical protein ACOX5M_05630 [Bacillota bacterium]|jgi:hypothetical protein